MTIARDRVLTLSPLGSGNTARAHLIAIRLNPVAIMNGLTKINMLSNPKRILAVSGDDEFLPLQLVKISDSGQEMPVMIRNTATIHASITSKDKHKIIIPPTQVFEGYNGSDWGQGIIVVVFRSRITDAIKHFGKNTLEIQVNDMNKSTWFSPINVIRGTI